MTELAAVLTNSGAPGARPRNSSSARSPRRPPASNAVTAYGYCACDGSGREGSGSGGRPPNRPEKPVARPSSTLDGRAAPRFYLLADVQVVLAGATATR